jgi:hypothetical protein
MGSSSRSAFVDKTGYRDDQSPEDWQVTGGSAAAQALADSDHTVAVLAQAIQHEIIPRLMLAHRTPLECDLPPSAAAVRVSQEDVVKFGQLILTRDEKQALTFITQMRGDGAPIEVIYLDLLAPAARYLGELWENDLCDFTDVTIGLGELQKMLRNLNSEVEQAKYPVPNGLSILLVPTPGEQHTFGLAMVAELFRKQGWEVVGGPYDLGESPEVLVAQRTFDVVGFSLATIKNLPHLNECITAVKKVSKNKTVCIMAGGPLFDLHPECVSQVDADLVTSDANKAPSLVLLHLSSGEALQ